MLSVTTTLRTHAITQMSQTAVWNRHHSVNQQLCRWLLLSLDRLPGNELVMTQELIASMLGVRREGVTKAALKLQGSSLIRYTRGRISVLDRLELKQRTCECYRLVKKEYDRLLPEKLAVRLAGPCRTFSHCFSRLLPLVCANELLLAHERLMMVQGSSGDAPARPGRTSQPLTRRHLYP